MFLILYVGVRCVFNGFLLDWSSVSDPTKAISQCADHFLRIHAMESPLTLCMDIRRSPAEQDMALISFYKQTNVEWARPLNCRLEGDTAIGHGVTCFFFSTCMEKMKSGFHINFANSSVTRLFEGEPGHLVPSASHFLVESDMFLMAGRMIGFWKGNHSFPKRIKCGSRIWPMPGTSKEGAGNISPEVLLQRIIWPREDDDDDDDDCSADIKCRVSGYLRQFITRATPTELQNLVKFWTGWEVLPTSLSVEVVTGRYPTASTCYETLRIPCHYKDYTLFQSDILASISTCHAGFGLV
ncbi:hypothetical protein MATL_G00257890 [Megalops atlanticus]|uniref:HECT domain-containing protein n=1 Tax=Megalops atlanticus TaxID=7932 RepID=A0A9D3T079_MEGAT|nr:hypothetical protein MATL_G00257890 [Megalops atlanticus]